MKIKVMISSVLLSLSAISNAQMHKTLDKIVAVVGSETILASDIEAQFYELSISNPNLSDTSKCEMMQTAIIQKILAQQALRDSLPFNDDEVEGALDNRIRYFVNQYGSEENLIRITGKSSLQLKDEFRKTFKEQLLAQKMQQEIVSKVKVSPSEVKSFFNALKEDEIPYFDAQLEIAQISIQPEASAEIENYTKSRLEELRTQILEGKKTFELAATTMSEDGSRDNGGDLGFISKEDVVPEFGNAAFKLKEGEISPVIKSKFGYHIIQLIKKKDDKVNVRHILLKPAITSKDINRAMDTVLMVRRKIQNDSMTFQNAVGKYSTDERSKMTGGFIVDDNNESLILLDKLEPSTLKTVSKLTVGSISEPEIYTDPYTGNKVVRILYLKSRTEPHKGNLKDDYNRFQEFAIRQKQTIQMGIWIQKNLDKYYIQISDDYSNCSLMDMFQKYISKN